MTLHIHRSKGRTGLKRSGIRIKQSNLKKVPKKKVSIRKKK